MLNYQNYPGLTNMLNAQVPDDSVVQQCIDVLTEFGTVLNTNGYIMAMGSFIMDLNVENLDFPDTIRVTSQYTSLKPKTTINIPATSGDIFYYDINDSTYTKLIVLISARVTITYNQFFVLSIYNQNETQELATIRIGRGTVRRAVVIDTPGLTRIKFITTRTELSQTELDFSSALFFIKR